MLMSILLGVALVFMWRNVSAIQETLESLDGKIHSLEDKLKQQKETIKAVSSATPPPALPIRVYSENTPKGPELTIKQPDYSASSRTASVNVRSGGKSSEGGKFFESVKSTFLAGHPIAKIAMLVVFVALAFLLRHTVFYSGMSLEWRLTGIVGIATIMLVDGLRLSAKRPWYSSTISCIGVSILYLTIYASFQLYNLLIPFTAFILLATVAVVAAFAALIQYSKSLAVMSIIGAFLVPVLLPTQLVSCISWFAYYAVLNVAVFGLAWPKGWRELNLIGFACMSVCAGWWGWQVYQDSWQWTAEAFLIYFFVYYTAVMLIGAYLRGSEDRGWVTSLFVVGLPVTVSGLQVALMETVPYALSFSALALCLYFGVAFGLLRLGRSRVLQSLQGSFAMWSIVFGTMSLPMAFSGMWLAEGLAFAGTVLLGLAFWLQDIRTRLFGGLVLMMSMIVFVDTVISLVPAAHYINELYLGGVFVFIASLVSAYFFHAVRSLPGMEVLPLYQDARTVERFLAKVYFIVGITGWYLLNVNQIELYLPTVYEIPSILGLAAVTSMVLWLFAEFTKWSWLRYAAIVLLPALGLMFMPGSLLNVSLASLFVWFVILYRHEKTPAWYLPICHTLSLTLIITFMTYELAQVVMNATHSDLWTYLTCGGVPAVFLYVVCFQTKLLSWPVGMYRKTYQQYGGSLLASYLAVWLVGSSIWSGDMEYFRYIPFINPIDGVILFALGGVSIWAYMTRKWLTSIWQGTVADLLLGVFCAMIFTWLNTVLFRSMHDMMHIPYDYISLRNSMQVQAYCSVLWTVIAVLATFIASRIRARTLWFIGFALLIVVGSKLCMVDMRQAPAINQAVTLVGIGMLLLINGYVLPLPPKR